eukprot:TRINITY_DN11658_c0_g1_i1.p1 TRINITY_DN11658_c0_g1~~TRINITY_DN11658_c0_g1_i1.p1  ORF type:complete len:667 (+),score=182.72 TRINITY_DN11658_c0_g1_i1:1116-3116(+)
MCAISGGRELSRGSNSLVDRNTSRLFEPRDNSLPPEMAHMFQQLLAQPACRPSQLFAALVDHYIAQMQRPGTIHHVPHADEQPKAATGVIGAIASTASKLLRLPWNAYSFFQNWLHSPMLSLHTPLADKSLLLLLGLVQAHADNPYRLALCSFHDTEYEMVDNEAPVGDNVVRISLSALYRTVVECKLVDDRAILMLYFLLHGNSLFLSYVHARTDIDTLVLPLLEILYKSVDSEPQRIYMILIIILILSHDQSFNKNIQKMKLPTVPWFKSRQLRKVSLGSLTVLVLVRTVQINLAKMRDVYLHSNCLAALSNMAAQMEDIHPLAANRLVKLFELLSKKYRRLAGAESTRSQAAFASTAAQRRSSATAVSVAQNGPLSPAGQQPAVVSKSIYLLASLHPDSRSDLYVRGSAPASPVSRPLEHSHSATDTEGFASDVDHAMIVGQSAHSFSDQSHGASLVQSSSTEFAAAAFDSSELEAYSDLMHMILKIVNSILCHSLVRNPHMIYSLLYQQDLFEPYRDHPRFGELVNNIRRTVQFYNDFMARRPSPDVRVDGVLALIREASLHWKSDLLTPFQHFKFKYEEEENPDDFFSPYVWSIIYQWAGASLHWKSDKIALFSVADIDDVDPLTGLAAMDNVMVETIVDPDSTVTMADPTMMVDTIPDAS